MGHRHRQRLSKESTTTQQGKPRINKWNHMELQNFWQQGKQLTEWSRSLYNGRKSSLAPLLTMNLDLEYIKNLTSLMPINQIPQSKNGPTSRSDTYWSTNGQEVYEKTYATYLDTKKSKAELLGVPLTPSVQLSIRKQKAPNSDTNVN